MNDGSRLRSTTQHRAFAFGEGNPPLEDRGTLGAGRYNQYGRITNRLCGSVTLQVGLLTRGARFDLREKRLHVRPAELFSSLDVNSLQASSVLRPGS